MAFTDCASGKILGHVYANNINAKIASDCLREVLDNVPRDHAYQIIIHTDRGAEYVSHEFQGLGAEYKHLNLLFSMSRAANPKDNAVAESLWRNLQKLIPLWTQLGYDPMPFFFDENQGKKVWKDFFNLYNSSHKGVRSMKLSGNLAELTIQSAIRQGLEVPPIHFTSNNPIGEVQMQVKNNIMQFKKDALKFDPSVEVLPEGTHEESNQNKMMQSLMEHLKLLGQTIVVSHNRLEEKIDSRSDLIESQLTAGFATKTTRKHKPKKLRSGLGLNTTRLIFSRWRKADVLDLRTIAVIVLQRACGCRVNEINPITLKQLRKLIETQSIEMFSTKLNQKEFKVISKSAARQLKVLLKHILKNLRASFNAEIPDDFYIFSSYASLKALPLSPNHFISSVNEFLAKIEKTFYEAGQFEVSCALRTRLNRSVFLSVAIEQGIAFNVVRDLVNELLTKANPDKFFYELNKNKEEGGVISSHSARIGFVSAAIEQGIPIDVIKDLVGHKDIRTTLVYNRFKTPTVKKINLLDQIENSNKKFLK